MAEEQFEIKLQFSRCYSITLSDLALVQLQRSPGGVEVEHQTHLTGSHSLGVRTLEVQPLLQIDTSDAG